MTYIPFLALLGGSVVGTAAEGIINGILNFITSPYFTALIVIVAVLIVLWILAARENISYLSVIICFVMFLVNDLYGFVSWKRMEKRQMATT